MPQDPRIAPAGDQAPLEEGGNLDSPRLGEVVLAQADVDELAGRAILSFSDSAGVRTVLDPGEPGRPALPVLEVALDRFARNAGSALRKWFGAADLSRRSIQTLRFGDYVDGLPLPVDAFAFRADGWAGRGLVTLGEGFVPLALDRLLGGGGSGRHARARSRPTTPIEAGILSRLVTLILEEAGPALSGVLPVTLANEGLIEKLEECDVARPMEEVLVVTFEIAADGRFAAFDLCFPASTIEPVRHLLAGRFTGEKLGRDERWAHHLATEVWQSQMEAEVVLHETRLPLGRVLDLAVGETLTFEVKPSDLVGLRCGPVLLTRGRMGRLDGKIALQVVEPLRPLPTNAVGLAPGATR